MTDPVIIVSYPLKEDCTKRGVFCVGDPNEHLFSTCTEAEDVKKPCTKDNLFAEIDAWKDMEHNDATEEELDIYNALKKPGTAAYICFFDTSSDNNLFLLGIVSMTLQFDSASTFVYLSAFLIHPRRRKHKYGTRLFYVVREFLNLPVVKDVFGYVPKYILLMTSGRNATFWEKQGFTHFDISKTQDTTPTEAERKLLFACHFAKIMYSVKMMTYALKH